MLADPLDNAALLLSGAAVCARLGIGKSTLHKMIRGGRFPLLPVRLGRAVRFRADELSTWVAAGCPAADRWRAMQLIKRAG